MARKEFHLLTLIILILASSAHAKVSSITLRFSEQASHIQLGSEKVELTEGQKPIHHKLNLGKTLKDYSVVVSMRPATINEKPGYIWLEAKLMDAKKKSVAYLTATVPQGKFTVGVGFTLSQDPVNPYVMMLDSTSEQ